MLLKSFTSRTDIVFAETPSAHTVNSSSVGVVQTVKNPSMHTQWGAHSEQLLSG